MNLEARVGQVGQNGQVGFLTKTGSERWLLSLIWVWFWLLCRVRHRAWALSLSLLFCFCSWWGWVELSWVELGP